MDGEELKTTFHRVNAYRHVCRAVKTGAFHTLISGCLFGSIAIITWYAVGFSNPIVWLFAALAVVEIGVGLWKHFRPSVECVLVDAITNFAFGGSVLVRYFLAQQRIINQPPHMISLIIGGYAIFEAWGAFQNYLRLRRLFAQRPTRQQMDYVREMVRDILDADPALDPTALDLPSEPPVKAQLAGDFAFIIDDRTGDAVVIDSHHLDLQRIPSGKDSETAGSLTLLGRRLPPFPLDEVNWRNYLRWKSESSAS